MTASGPNADERRLRVLSMDLRCTILRLSGIELPTPTRC